MRVAVDFHYLSRQGFEGFLSALVSQPMMQCGQNRTQFRSMDCYVYANFFVNSKKFPPPCTEKSPKDEEKSFFAYFFGFFVKFRYKNPSILAPFDSVDVAS